MLSFQTALTFFGISLVLGLSPGPDNVFVLMQSATQGRKAGMLVVLGLCTGLVVHTVAIAFGLAAIFAASALAFLVLKVLGAAYLAYLAWGAFWAPVSAETNINANTLRPRQLYLRGVIMNLTNPKVVFFFLAFLPQFVSAERGSVGLQFIALGAIFIAATIITFGSISYFAATAGQKLRGSATAQRWMNRAAAFVFAGLALKLALSQR
ncbi:LysE family translocator [Undibacterium sp. RuRC25W]|uniref:LysE family translocator n=1 Tax=Undibacterium sp. RuRC25W TaxID=3413047 RepID=UPI003BF333B0